MEKRHREGSRAEQGRGKALSRSSAFSVPRTSVVQTFGQSTSGVGDLVADSIVQPQSINSPRFCAQVRSLRIERPEICRSTGGRNLLLDRLKAKFLQKRHASVAGCPSGPSAVWRVRPNRSSGWSDSVCGRRDTPGVGGARPAGPTAR